MPDSRSGDPGSKASTSADNPGRSTRTTLQKILIVTGTPGTGKTVLAKLIAEKEKAELVNLGELIKKKKLYRRYDRSRRSYIIDEKRLRKSLLTLFNSYRGKDLVIETNWLGKFMPKRSGMTAVVIRADPVVLAGRLERRGWAKRKIWENVEAELIDLSLYDSLKFLGGRRVYQVDATRKRPGELLRTVSKLISGDRGWEGFTPNWLERYDPIELSRKIL